MSNASRIADLVQITNRLSDLLERESAILSARKLSEMESVREEKFTLSAAYETHVRALRSQPEILLSATPALREQLKAAFDRFEDSLGKNERGLRAAREASDRVLRAIADEVDRQRRDKLAYSANGHTSAPHMPGSRPAVSVAVDERF
jgi:flagellar biosynthesis/type III secretory pathway chaperone